MDRGAWQTVVQEVTELDTTEQLSTQQTCMSDTRGHTLNHWAIPVPQSHPEGFTSLLERNGWELPSALFYVLLVVS